jgi:hypothetical protein
MRFQYCLALVCCAGCGLAQQFSSSDRDSVMRYWSRPDRYTVSIPDDATTAGIWQVRLTVAGSQWLWNYQKGKRVPPTETPVPQSGQEKDWDTWIQAKVAHDRWQALMAAQNANEKILGKRLPEADKAAPVDEPPQPGPIPADLQAAVGDCPPLASAVVPMKHTVTFDDLSLTYKDHTRLSSPRYAYYRFDDGVMSVGTPAKSMAPDHLAELCKAAGIDESCSRVMKAVSILEGGFDSVNTYDTGFVSVGFIQFASLSGGSNSLGALLKNYKDQFPSDFDSDFRNFGIDVTTDGVLDVLDLSTGAELTGPDANRQIIEDKRLIAVFQRAGLKSDKFNAMQLKTAHDLYLPSLDPISIQIGGRTVTGVVSDFVKSEAGMAILMDRKVNTGKIDPLVQMVSDLANELQIQSLSELAPYEHDLVAAVRYRKDYLADPTLTQPAPSPSSRWSTQRSRSSSGRTGRGGHS